MPPSPGRLEEDEESDWDGPGQYGGKSDAESAHDLGADSDAESSDEEGRESDNEGRPEIIDLEAIESNSENGNGSDEDDDDDDDMVTRRSRSAAFSIRPRMGPDEWVTETRDFPQFERLPYELRKRIWEMYCPDMNGKARVLEFGIESKRAPKSKDGVATSLGFSPSNSTDIGPPFFVRASDFLPDQTQGVRLIMATNRESRDMALRRFPHVLKFSDEEEDPDEQSPPYQVFFNRATDVVRLVEGPWGFAAYGHMIHKSHILHGFSDQIEHLALTPRHATEANAAEVGLIDETGPAPENPPTMDAEGLENSDEPGAHDLHFLLTFTRLKYLYSCLDGARDPDLASDPDCRFWCMSDHVVSRKYRMFEMEPGLGEDREQIYVWHPADTTQCDPSGACKGVRRVMDYRLITSRNGIFSRKMRDPGINSDDEARIDGLRLIPLRLFDSHDSSGALYEELVRAKKPQDSTVERLSYRAFQSYGQPGTLGDDDLLAYADDDELDDEENEYESEGIDDNPVEEPQTEDEDEQGSGIEDDTLAMELAQDGEDSRGHRFSSMDNDSASSAPQSPSKRPAARRVVLDDSDDDDDDVEEIDPPPRPSQRQARIVLGDSDEEDGQRAQETLRGKKRTRVVSDDEEDDDSEVQEVDVPRRPAKRRAQIVESDEEDSGSDVQEVKSRPNGSSSKAPVVVNSSSDSDEESSSSEESDEDDEDEGGPQRPLSLMERLAQHRKETEAEMENGNSDADSSAEEQSDFGEGDYRRPADMDDDDDLGDDC